MGRSTKRALLAFPLVVVAYYVGLVCARLGRSYDLVLLPSVDLLWLLIQLVSALWLLSVAAGVAATLVRPVRAAIVAFALSGLAILAGLGWSGVGGAAVLLYVVAGCAYARRVSRDLAERTTFASRPISEAQTVLMVALVLLASTSAYVGFAARIEAEGFSIPSTYKEGIVARLEAAVEEYLPKLVRDLAIDVIREGIAFAVDKVLVGAVEPIQESIPLVVAVALFMPLLAVTRVLAWVPALALRAVFAALKSLRVVRVVRATREVERLVVW